jgi:VWFA-related protein
MTTNVSTERQDPPVFRAGSTLVRVFVTVTDGEGRLVTDLRREDFSVRDNGRLRPIDVFDDTPVPIRLVTMLDVSGSMARDVEVLRKAADELFQRLSADDLARVGFFGNRIRIASGFTRDVTTLRSTLPEPGDAGGLTPLWLATDTALRSFPESSGGHRRVILIMSDGKDSSGAYLEKLTADDIVARAQQADVMIYGIGLPNRISNRATTPGSFRSSLDDNKVGADLARVAGETGGGYAELGPRDDLSAEFSRVMRELHSQYLLGFYTETPDGKVHELDVRVSRRGMKPRARKSYIATSLKQ